MIAPLNSMKIKRVMDFNVTKFNLKKKLVFGISRFNFLFTLKLLKRVSADRHFKFSREISLNAIVNLP